MAHWDGASGVRAAGSPLAEQATREPDRAPWKPEAGCGGRRALGAALAAMLLAAPMVGAGVWAIQRDAAAREAERAATQQRYRAHDRLVNTEPGPVLATDLVQRGRGLFLATCAACHNAAGTGVEGLGRDLTTSWFVAANSDAELARFLEVGRPADSPLNASKVPMPPRGGNDALTHEDLASVVAYLRGLQDARRMPPLPAEAPVMAYTPPSEAQTAKWLASAKGDAELAGYIASGSRLFAMTCSACHGKDARGLKGNGKDLVVGEFCKSLDDDALLAFVQRGRDPSDPANTTGVGMPAKGGNPAMSEDDLLDIIAFLRALQDGVPK